MKADIQDLKERIKICNQDLFFEYAIGAGERGSKEKIGDVIFLIEDV